MRQRKHTMRLHEVERVRDIALIFSDLTGGKQEAWDTANSAIESGVSAVKAHRLGKALRPLGFHGVTPLGMAIAILRSQCTVIERWAYLLRNTNASPEAAMDALDSVGLGVGST